MNKIELKLTSVMKSLNLAIKREFKAPIDLVFDVLTDQDHLMKWSCPTDFKTTFGEGELKIGGKWRIGMRSSEGKDYVMRGNYKEIQHPTKLVYTHFWENDDGTMSLVTEVTITLSYKNKITTMRFEQKGFESEEVRDAHLEGWNEAFDNFDAFIIDRK